MKIVEIINSLKQEKQWVGQLKQYFSTILSLTQFLTKFVCTNNVNSPPLTFIYFSKCITDEISIDTTGNL